MWRLIAVLGLCLFAWALLAAPIATADQINIATVVVGNPGNAGEVSGTGTLFETVVGAVDYEFKIGTFEVTNDQYAAFLNAKARESGLGLYDLQMGSSPWGGIERHGEPGSYTFTPKPNMGNKPVVFIHWNSAIRFTNWLHNGQGDGDTEAGAYTLLGGTAIPSNAGSVVRNPGAKWFLPTEDEWYKAAYYDPTLNDGTGGYWNFATQSNVAPQSATANSVGDIANPGPNVANVSNGAVWNNLDGNVTTVGSAGPLSASYYGTYDQTGNAVEWHETGLGLDPWFGGSRGGAFGADAWDADHRPWGLSVWGSRSKGFRVATVVPEPATRALGALGLACVLLTFARSRQR